MQIAEVYKGNTDNGIKPESALVMEEKLDLFLKYILFQQAELSDLWSSMPF